VSIEIWGPGISTVPRPAASEHRSLVAVGNGHALKAMALSMSPSRPIAVSRYRAEGCSGDYVCGADGPWEPAAATSAGGWPLTSDGF
jgi:hypothetical protein